MTSNERALEVLRKAKLTRYEHGGGRLFVDGPAGARELVADFYNEDTRELIMSLIEAAIRPVETFARQPGECPHERAQVLCPDCGINLIGGLRGAPRDVPIWICSVCGGWNHVQDRFCTHTHAGRPAQETPSSLQVPSGWRGKDPWFKVGDRVLPLNALYRHYPVHTITEITERGFKYSHARMPWGPARNGAWTEGGETFEPCRYELAAQNGNGEV